MPLLSVWQSNPTAVTEFSIEQVVATAGDGSLKDGSVCSQELRAYFAQVSSEKLASYVEQCLSSRFEKGGMVLQVLINELGRRLDYKVTNGRYQGTSNKVGFDGIWVSPEGRTIIAEVKTTDVYRISLDTIAGYRQKLLADKTVSGEPSILIVVGRQDTGELEAQVRGSRHAWDIRLISAEALIKLTTLKENSDEPETGRKIRSVLMPLEYTRLDRLVDVMFTAATDVEPVIAEAQAEDIMLDASTEPPKEGTAAVGWEFTDATLLQQKREQIINAMSKRIGSPLVKKSRALYWTADHDQRVACTISKRYTKKGSQPYWYAYHPPWDEFLAEAAESYLILGCMDLPFAFAIPRSKIRNLLEGLHKTDSERGTYYHIHIVESSAGGL
jgi:hypothetical protein